MLLIRRRWSGREGPGGAAKEYANEYQQFGEGRELSDCGPAPAGNKVTC